MTCKASVRSGRRLCSWRAVLGGFCVRHWVEQNKNRTFRIKKVKV